MFPRALILPRHPNGNGSLPVISFSAGSPAGCYFLAVLIDLFGRMVDRPMSRRSTGEREAPPDCVFVGRRGGSSKSRGKAAPEARDRRAYARARLFGINDFVKLALRRLLQ